LLQGQRHSNGGILIEAEDGEMVMNRRSTQMFLPQLREMQRVGNGNTGIVSNGFAEDGGLIVRNIQKQSNLGEVQKLIEGNIYKIQVNNIATDTLDVANEEIILVNNANI